MSIAQWHQFLQNSAAQNLGNNDSQPVIADGKVIGFSDAATEQQSLLHDTVICDLSHLGLLQVQGADALTFLQGQVTNDVKQLNGRNAHYSGYCNPKGRLLALFLAFVHHDYVHLQLPKELIEPISKRLKMFVMRSKVEIKDVSDQIIRIGLNGSKATALLSSIFSQIPQNNDVTQSNYELVSLENAAILKLPGMQPRYEIFTDISNAPAIWNALLQEAKPVGAACWEWLEIQAGIPDVTLKTQEAFVPQMLNLDLLGGINFKKGCYTGQEIVARTHYLGTVKRRTQLAHISASSPPSAGDDVHNSQHEIIGKIVRSAPSPVGGYDVLAELRLESLEAGQLLVNNNVLEIQPLPYKL
jgi:folate-binding protein YgfZ